MKPMEQTVDLDLTDTELKLRGDEGDIKMTDTTDIRKQTTMECCSKVLEENQSLRITVIDYR